MTTLETDAPIIHQVHTPCANCIFAQYEGNLQTGCQFNRLEIYKEKGCLVEAEDNEKQFYIVNGRLCLANRSQFWKDKQTDDDLVAVARKEIQVSYDYVIYMGPGDSIIMMMTTLNDLLSQPILPKKVVIVNNAGTMLPVDVVNAVNSTVNGKTLWSINNITELADQSRATHMVVRNFKNKLFIVVNAGSILPPDFIKKLDIAINDKIIDFVAIRPDDNGNLLVSNPLLYKTIGGHKNGSYIEKLEQIQAGSENKNQYPIINREDILCLQ